MTKEEAKRIVGDANVFDTLVSLDECVEMEGVWYGDLYENYKGFRAMIDRLLKALKEAGVRC